MDILKLVGRNQELFQSDINKYELELFDIIGNSNFLVLGGAGSIGQAVVKEIFKREPRKLHVVDISENNMVELVRDIRSSLGYIRGEFQTFVLDVGSLEYDAFIEADGSYDYVLNLSALKHVRSEKDPYTLMRMIDVNILYTDKTIQQSIRKGVKKYFCVSTDKAANPVNMMGASKRIMEMFLMRRSRSINISTARFANVAFSDGSLLHGFNQRFQKRQPIVAPHDIKRYFLTPQESGELCLMSCLFGENGDIFFPKLNESLHLKSFADIAAEYLENKGYVAHICESEKQARDLFRILYDNGEWACYFSQSDTTGEKEIEEFYTREEVLDMHSFSDFGVIKNSLEYDNYRLIQFEESIATLKKSLKWTKDDLINLFHFMLSGFTHIERFKHLDSKM